MCEEVAGNADCGLSDTVMEEESFQTADVEACRSDFHLEKNSKYIVRSKVNL